MKFNEATLEHVIPLGMGGRDHPDNWDISCWRCNQREGKWVSHFCNKRKRVQVEDPKSRWKTWLKSASKWLGVS